MLCQYPRERLCHSHHHWRSQTSFRISFFMNHREKQFPCTHELMLTPKKICADSEWLLWVHSRRTSSLFDGKTRLSLKDDLKRKYSRIDHLGRQKNILRIMFNNGSRETSSKAFFLPFAYMNIKHPRFALPVETETSKGKYRWFDYGCLNW